MKQAQEEEMRENFFTLLFSFLSRPLPNQRFLRKKKTPRPQKQGEDLKGLQEHHTDHRN